MAGIDEKSHLQDGLTLRIATKDDLDDIVSVVQAGFPNDPDVDYRFALRKQFPEDYVKWTRKEYGNYIEQPKKFVVYLIEAFCKSDHKITWKVVALAVWDIAVLTESNGTIQGLDKRRDANKKHCAAYDEGVARCFKEYFAKYNENQIHLWLIVTHPEFRRRGAGKMLMDWGVRTAEEWDWPITLFASPMGEMLYLHLEFKKIATEYIQANGEDEKLPFSVMEYWPMARTD